MKAKWLLTLIIGVWIAAWCATVQSNCVEELSFIEELQTELAGLEERSLCLSRYGSGAMEDVTRPTSRYFVKQAMGPRLTLHEFNEQTKLSLGRKGLRLKVRLGR